MKNRKLFLFIAIFVFLLSTLACGLVEGAKETTNNIAPTDPPNASTSPQEPASDSSTDDKQSNEEEPSSPSADVLLGEEFRSEEGGYAFQLIPSYAMEDFFGLTSLVAPDADPDLGPMLMLIGGTNEEEATEEDIFGKFMQEAKNENLEILSRKEIRVDNQAGILAEISGEIDDQQVTGRIVVVAVTPTHQFTMFASALEDRWKEIEPLFDAVLDSIYFFEPKEVDLSEAIEEFDEEEIEETDEPDESLVPPIGEFPTAYDQLPSGGFVYLLASSDGGLPIIVDQGFIQDQSTSAEYVIGLVSEDERNTVTLFIPSPAAPGILVMNPYDADSATQGPGAAVYMGLTRYTNTDGMIMIEVMDADTISGTFSFLAADEDGKEIVVTGFFNELSLEPNN